jgi:hypothetical protein
MECDAHNPQGKTLENEGSDIKYYFGVITVSLFTATSAPNSAQWR